MEIDYSKIRGDIVDSIRAYADDGVPPGDFVRKVLENDLMGAFGKADSDNVEAMFHICGYVFNEIPVICWGSPSKVDDWLKKKRMERCVILEAGGMP